MPIEDTSQASSIIPNITTTTPTITPAKSHLIGQPPVTNLTGTDSTLTEKIVTPKKMQEIGNNNEPNGGQTIQRSVTDASRIPSKQRIGKLVQEALGLKAPKVEQEGGHEGAIITKLKNFKQEVKEAIYYAPTDKLKEQIGKLDGQIKEKEDEIDKFYELKGNPNLSDKDKDKLISIEKELPKLNKDVSKLIIEQSKLQSKYDAANSRIETLKLKESVLEDRVANKSPEVIQKKVITFVSKLVQKGTTNPREAASCIRQLKDLQKEFSSTDNCYGPGAARTFNNDIQDCIDALKLNSEVHKMDKIAKQMSEFKHIAQGKAKHVWRNISDPNSAFYTAVKLKGPLEAIVRLIEKSKENEIRDEVEMAKQIKADLKEQGVKDTDETNLAIDYEELEGDAAIKGEYTVKTAKAGVERVEIVNGRKKTKVDLDLEQKVRNDPLKFPQSIEVGLDVVKGMANLHRTGRCQGDFKLENVLIYQVGKKIVARITDWGKTKKMDKDQVIKHTGNPRYAPPEGRLSQKGEVYSTGIALIRIIEGQFLGAIAGAEGKVEKGMLLEPPNKDKSVDASKRDGVEKYLVQNKDCPQSEVKTLKGKIKVYGRTAGIEVGTKLKELTKIEVGIPTQKELQKAQDAVHAYIDALEEKLNNLPENKDKKIPVSLLCGLLKRMTSSDPDKRPDMSQVQAYYSNIMPFLNPSSQSPPPT